MIKQVPVYFVSCDVCGKVYSDASLDVSEFSAEQVKCGMVEAIIADDGWVTKDPPINPNTNQPIQLEKLHHCPDHARFVPVYVPTDVIRRFFTPEE